MGALQPPKPGGTWSKSSAADRSTSKREQQQRKIAGWMKAVEKLCAKQAALSEQAAVASRLKLAESVRALPTPPA